MKFLFDDPAFDYQALRAAGYADFGGAQLGEVIAVASRIPGGDTDAWRREWTALAERVHGLAAAALAQRRTLDARAALLRAHTYYRTAEFFLRDDPLHDPEAARLMRLSKETFAEAAQLMERPPEFVRIPYGDGSLPGYFYRADDSAGPRPTLIHHGGIDSTLEEGYFFIAAAARARGYHVLCFEGPGQGSVLREQGLTFRPDWEEVVTPVVDFALAQPGVDPERVTLVGTSLGGLLAVRAAAFEHRLAGCVAHDAVWQLGDVVWLPPFVHEWVEQGCDDFANPVMYGIAVQQTFTRWLLRQAMWTFGAQSPSELLRRMPAFGLADVVGQVRCPVLVLDAEEDMFFAGLEHAKKVYTGLNGPKTLHVFTADEGGGAHCHSGSMTLFHDRVFSWLAETSPAGAPEPGPAPSV
ncbi:alpha/beta fold hydrolase [Streptomyces sp. BPTC-684]|uniref:alpha/beta hydrolase family protein n=1 Tax=Streptomyces sp. BPTC-684 TaxID=3043734 RepID=UPI0024B0F25A|nr:alpha/beta fold hydrolase [Streptomyces sp. BPTC-684]WHM40331.1 alpha/beta fold hydrolase [Streptomyces sp. BPTC-684]